MDEERAIDHNLKKHLRVEMHFPYSGTISLSSYAVRLTEYLPAVSFHFVLIRAETTIGPAVLNYHNSVTSLNNYFHQKYSLQSASLG